jgi:polyhydroxybutyrate depolymerase
MTYASQELCLLMALGGVADGCGVGSEFGRGAQGLVCEGLTLQTSLENTAAVTLPIVGPGGIDRWAYYMAGYSGRGASFTDSSRAVISFPSSAINLSAGSLELWYRPNSSPGADSTRRTLFAVALAPGSPVMELSESDALRFVVRAPTGTFEAAAPRGALVWPRWSWSLIRVEWDRESARDSLRVFVNGTRAPTSLAPGGWSLAGTDPASRLYVGTRDGAGGSSADGIVDEVFVWGRAGGLDAGVMLDAGVIDSGVIDGGSADTGPADGGTADAGLTDTGSPPPQGSAGCIGAVQAAGVFSRRLNVRGVVRSYILAVPAGYDQRTPIYLTFGWHGNSWNGSSFRAATNMESFAQGRSIFAYGDGLPVGGASGWVNDAEGRDIAFFDALYAELGTRYCVDQSHVFSFGRSMGAGFANALACHRGSLLRATASMSGWGPTGGCGVATSAWIAHQRDDATIAYAEGVASRDHWLAANGCSATSTRPGWQPSCVEYYVCAPGRTVGWCSQATGGHTPPTWAREAIWRFFVAR